MSFYCWNTIWYAGQQYTDIGSTCRAYWDNNQEDNTADSMERDTAYLILCHVISFV